MKVFSSFLDPGLDLDLLPHWIRHYQSFNYDRYAMFIHCKSSNTLAVRTASQWFKEAGWLCHEVWDESSRSTGFHNGLMQSEYMEYLKKTLDPEDILITADSDEFHDLDPVTCEVLLNYCDWIGGYLLDRWGDALCDADPEIPLHIQYHNQGSMIETIKKEMGVAADPFFCIQRKIIASKVRLPVNYQGMHGFKDCTKSLSALFAAGDDKQVSLPHYDDVDVLHYSWRSSVLRRIHTKSYYPWWFGEGLVKKFLVDGPLLAEYHHLVSKKEQEQNERYGAIARML